jgi:hypothetical protein
VLRWARGHDCPWEEMTCHAPLWAGTWMSLKWAQDHGCLWDGRTIEASRASGCEETIQYVSATGRPSEHFLSDSEDGMEDDEDEVDESGRAGASRGASAPQLAVVPRRPPRFARSSAARAIHSPAR